MVLLIDTNNHNDIHFALISEKATDGVAEFNREVAFNENYKTLEFLQTFFKKQKITFRDIKKIVVCSGPGSFTGIRVGVAMAQSFGLALDIPVSAISKDKIPADLTKLLTMKFPKKLILTYGREPNITKSKKTQNP